MLSGHFNKVSLDLVLLASLAQKHERQIGGSQCYAHFGTCVGVNYVSLQQMHSLSNKKGKSGLGTFIEENIFLHLPSMEGEKYITSNPHIHIKRLTKVGGNPFVSLYAVLLLKRNEILHCVVDQINFLLSNVK